MHALPEDSASMPILNAESRGAESFSTAVAPARILIVTPEISAVSFGMSRRAGKVVAKAGGLADVSGALVQGLEKRGVPVHLALPNYRSLFGLEAEASFKLGSAESVLPDSERRLHLAEDRVFYYRSHVYGGPEAHLAAAAFQREVINGVIARVRPDLIHCHDWMTGLIPAFAKRHGIPCLFTMHNVHTDRRTMSFLEDRGIDTASFWEHLYFDRRPENYHETRGSNCCDLLASALHAADHVSVVSPNFLSEIVAGFHDFVPGPIRAGIRAKAEAGCATGVINSPDASYDPRTDPHLRYQYGPADFEQGKMLNKLFLQDLLGLETDPEAPILFWPSRLDPVQKGCQLFTEVLQRTVSDYDHLGLQIVTIADGPYQCHLHEIMRDPGLDRRVACVSFEEGLSRCGFAGADFVLMPSLFEPCGLPQMIGVKYGTLPIARNTGGIHDTVRPLDPAQHTGNGFLFDTYDADGFRWAIDEALAFYQRARHERNGEIRRIMGEAAHDFSEEVMIAHYVSLYEQILERPLTPAPEHSRGMLTSPLPVARRSAASGGRSSDRGRRANDPIPAWSGMMTVGEQASRGAIH